MKNLLTTTAIFFLLAAVITNAQSITNTLGAGGLFKVKDATTDFFTLDQSNGNISLISYLAGNQQGSIFKGGERFIHTYYGSGTVGHNTFLGINAGNFTMGGIGNQGSYNTGAGYASLYSNTTGLLNSAFGYYSLYSNTDGGYNSAFGLGSLQSNITGGFNSAFGVYSLQSNTTGYDNSAFGWNSLLSNTTGYDNSALGYLSGNGITSGSNNTTIGYNARVPNGALSNQVRIGDTYVTYAGIEVAWTVTSDRRLKSNILNSNLGLDFISKLRPVSYFRNNDEKLKTEYGFIAQEVEEVLKDYKADNTGMISVDDKGMYSLRYNDFIAPMVKAIQELNEKNEKLEIKNEKLEERLAKYEAIQNKLVKNLEKMESREETINVQLVKFENNNQ